MDIQKTMQAINAAQNAADKVKPFLYMVETLGELWLALKEINPDELTKMAAQRDDLIKSFGDLMDQKQKLITDIGSIDADYQAKKAALTSEYDALRKQLESAHAARIADLQAQIVAEQQHAKSVLDEYNSQTRSLLSKKEGLEVQIAQLKNLANSVVHA